jgi:predicted double-glycine peptidase
MLRFGPHLAAGLLAAAGLTLSAAGAAQAQVTVNEGLASYRVPVATYRDTPFRSVVRQQYDFSCGSAALATLLHYHYEEPVTEADVFRAMWAEGNKSKIRKVGFSLMDMKRYLATRGFIADGYRINVDQLTQMKAPAIAVIKVGNYRHFVVIKGAKDGKVLVGDPALGLKSYSDQEFATMWNGVVFMIRSGPSHQATFNKASDWSVWAETPLNKDALDASSVSAATRALPPLYQVLNTMDLSKWGNMP